LEYDRFIGDCPNGTPQYEAFRNSAFMEGRNMSSTSMEQSNKHLCFQETSLQILVTGSQKYQKGMAMT